MANAHHCATMTTPCEAGSARCPSCVVLRSSLTCCRSARTSVALVVATFLVLVEKLRDDSFERNRDVGVQLDRSRRLAIQDGIEYHRGRAPLKRPLSGRHLVEDEPERKQIRSGVEIFSARLLRRHVGDRPECHTGTSRQQLRQHFRLRRRTAARRCRSVRVSVDLASPKSSTFTCSRAVTKMFAGLMSRCRMPRACAASSASQI